MLKTVGELLDVLGEFDRSQQLRIFDVDTGDWLDVTGVRVSSDEDVEDGGAQAEHPFTIICASS
jgi:hypothetical protein